MLMGTSVAGGEAEDSGEDSLAHICPGAPDLKSTQFWPYWPTNWRHDQIIRCSVADITMSRGGERYCLVQ